MRARRVGPRGVAALAGAVVLAWAAPALADPIPGSPTTSSPQFVGAPATPDPVAGFVPPRHPFMAPNGRSNIHVDAYQTDTNTWAGPLGRSMQTTSVDQNADCASVAFDSQNRVVTTCIGVQGPTSPGGGLYLFDARTLAPLAQMDLPARQPSAGNPFTNFGAGGYFYLDNQDRAVIPTTTRHIWVVGETSGPGFALQHDYDLSGTLASDDEIESALPDWLGRIWFASTHGVVGTVDPVTGAIRTFDTGETIGNSFAVDASGGVYIVTDNALYRFDAAADGTPTVTWRATYANDGTSKPGQTEVGSGTTPTVMSGGLVSITDNADPIDVDVFRTAPTVSGSRLVCSQPVFSKGASDTDQSLIAVGDAMVAENNYGYASPAAVEEGRTTTGGLERVDVNANGSGCHTVWHSDEIAPSVVPKASLANGLVYTYTHPGGDTSDPWYLTALDFRTGRTVFKYRVGTGLGYNNNYAPVTLGPDGTAYVGVLGGLALARDAVPPPGAGVTTSPASGGGAKARRPRVHFRVRRNCARSEYSLSLAGADARRVRSMRLTLNGHSFGTLLHPPFDLSIVTDVIGSPPAHVRPTRLRAVVTLRDGRRMTLRTTLRPCRRRAAARFTG